MAMTGNEVSLTSEMRRYSIELKLFSFFFENRSSRPTRIECRWSEGTYW